MGYDAETCSQCGRNIELQEQACVFNGKIVCKSCDSKLRANTNESGLCFFCQKEKALPDASEIVALHKTEGIDNELKSLANDSGEPQSEGPSKSGSSYLLCRVTVPRCAGCKAYHRHNVKVCKCLMYGFLSGPVLIGASLGYYFGVREINTDPNENMPLSFFVCIAAFVGLLLGCFLGALAGVIEISTRRIRVKDKKPLSHKKHFPRLSQLIRLGWWYGERPKTKQKLSPIEVDAYRLAQILPEPKSGAARAPLLIGGAILYCLAGVGLVILGVFIILKTMGEYSHTIMGLASIFIGIGCLAPAAKMLKKTGLW